MCGHSGVRHLGGVRRLGAPWRFLTPWLNLIMRFTEGSFYHIYNRGNNKQKIFFTNENYFFFLEKVKKYICPNCDLISWVLMPNHFHFLIRANTETCRLIKQTPIEINTLTEGIRLLLSSYSKAIQKQESKTGNLFQQKTKSKCVDTYVDVAFQYIHQNAFNAGLCSKLEDWEFSSFKEYTTTGTKNLCSTEIGLKYLNIDPASYLKDSYAILKEDQIVNIF
jgi:putative transposase